MKRVINKTEKNSSANEARYTNVILERMEDSIKLVLEGQIGLQRQLDVANEEARNFREEMCSFREEMYSFRKEANVRFDRIEANQQATFDYLSHTDNRLEDVEKELQEIKLEIASLKKIYAKNEVGLKRVMEVERKVIFLEKVLIKQKLLKA